MPKILRQGDKQVLPVVFWMMGAAASFVVAAVSIRTLSLHFNVFEINSIRTAGGLLLLLVALACWPHLREQLKIAAAPLHVPRNVVNALGGALWTISIALLPLATVFSLEFTTPAWAALLAYPILGERVTRNTVFGIALSLVGVLFILRPTPSSFNVIALAPLGAALCFAVSLLLTRRLTRTEGVFAILFWMMIIQLPLNLIGIIFAPSSGVVSSFSTPIVLAIAGLAIAGLCSQLCLSKALQIGLTTIVMPLDFLRVPLIAIIGATMYGEPFDIWVFTGFAIIATGIGIGVLIPERSPARASAGKVPSG